MKLAKIKAKKGWYVLVEAVVKYFNDIKTKKNNEKHFRKENKIRNRKNVYCPKCYSTDVIAIENRFDSGNSVVKVVALGSNKIEMNCMKCGYKFKHCK